MEDAQIVELYWQRDEQAIAETAARHGRVCYRVAYNILNDRLDAEECVNDTYIKAWHSLPPHRPTGLAAFLCKITRHLSLNRWRDRSREKRGGGETPLALDELAECVSDGSSTEQAVDHNALTRALNDFLALLPAAEREVFVCRYWFLASSQQIGQAFDFSESKVRSMLLRTRSKLKRYLEKEGLL
ncbi:MAG: RNA polymerase sigma factor [Faecalibacterium sp.]|nr:RNA polymerase sigma factor [Faecalibacterium sp.]